jgi:hypothetical protein
VLPIRRFALLFAAVAGACSTGSEAVGSIVGLSPETVSLLVRGTEIDLDLESGELL